MASTIIFTARIITGAGRGKTLGTPTMNLDLSAVPRELAEGVYAVRARLGGGEHPATMHFGARPTFGDTTSCEVHLIEGTGDSELGARELTIEVVQRLRGVQKFADAEALKKQLAEDIARAREILYTGTHEE